MAKRGLKRVFKSLFSSAGTFAADTTLYSLLVLLVGIGIGMALATVWSRKHENFEGQKELLLLHMEGCPHCVELMPKWGAFAKENNTGIKTRVVERKEDPALVKKHGVRGFPTILLLDGRGEKLKTYGGPRTKNGLLKFCAANK